MSKVKRSAGGQSERRGAKHHSERQHAKHADRKREQQDVSLAGYDPGTDWTAMGLSDEEIARRLQIEEANPTPESIGAIAPPSIYTPMPVALNRDLDRYKDTRIDDLKRERDSAERRERKAELEREYANKKQRDAERSLSLERYPLAKVNRLYDLDDYSRYYDYIPSGYSAFERTRLKNLIARLLERDIKTLSDYEIEEKIKKLIEEKKTPVRRVSTRKSSKRRSKSPKRKSPKRKSPKKKSPKRR